jgi:L-iditol 2-dehydrogenase
LRFFRRRRKRKEQTQLSGKDQDDMRAVFLHGPEDLRVEETPRPTPGEGELLLKVASVCVCGSDLHYYLEGGLGARKIETPHIPGHEVAARVWDERAEEMGLTHGQLVAIEPTHTCGQCAYCLSDRPNLCPHVQFHGGPPHHGAMSEFMVASRADLFPVPEEFTPVQAAALEPVGVGLHALNKTDLRMAESVAILGCGPIGLILLQLARAAGAGQIMAIDPIGYRTAKALSLGADKAADSYEAVADWTGGQGADVVLEATNSPDAFAHAVEAVRPGGRIILVGIPTGTHYAPLDALPLRSKEVTIKTCFRMGRVHGQAIEAIQRGHVDVDSLITAFGTLDDAPALFASQAACENGALKSVILPNG